MATIRYILDLCTTCAYMYVSTYLYMKHKQYIQSAVCAHVAQPSITPYQNSLCSTTMSSRGRVSSMSSEQYVTRGTICYTCVYITPQQIHVIPAVHWPPMAGAAVHVHTILCPHLSSYYYHFTCQQPQKVSFVLHNKHFETCVPTGTKHIG